MAWFRRKPAAALIHHSDRGSHAFQNKLAEFGIQCSKSEKGDCRDNAPTESFFNSPKSERVHGTRYTAREEANAEIFEYIEAFYNRKQLHSTVGYTSPQPCLQHWINSQHGSELAEWSRDVE